MSDFADTTSATEQAPPFEAAIHLRSAQPNAEETAHINSFRALLEDFPLYHKHAEWADDAQLLRFLVARNFKLIASADLIKGALKWREHRQPAQIEQSCHWPEGMSKESETGKIYCPGHDKWGRSVLVFDNAAQNTKSVDNQMTFLAWNLEFAIKLMKPNVDKYLVFMHLGAFSFFNNPPFAATKETINMLCNCFPERLGHCIAYQPPAFFKIFFNTVKGFLDPKTANKIVFIIGDVSEGSENDRKMRELVGDDWKVLVGAEQPVLSAGSSPGYDHDAYWPTVLDRLAALKTDQTEKTEQTAGTVEGDAENQHVSTGSQQGVDSTQDCCEEIAVLKLGNSNSSSSCVVAEVGTEPCTPCSEQEAV